MNNDVLKAIERRSELLRRLLAYSSCMGYYWHRSRNVAGGLHISKMNLDPRKGWSGMIITLSDLLTGIRERKAALGIIDTPERTDAMRNSGSRRTARKRAMLARIEERSRDAGVV